MTKAFDLFLPDLMPLAPGCPEPTAELALKRTAQRFCELTRAWRVTLDPLMTVAAIDTYDLELPERSELVRIESAAREGGRPLAVATPNGELSRHTDYVACDDGKTLVLNPVPSAGWPLMLVVTLKPSNSAFGVEDFIYDRHVSVIARGAAGLLKQHPKKTYSANDGADLWDEFEKRCSTIRNALWRGNARNTPRTKPNWF